MKYKINNLKFIELIKVYLIFKDKNKKNLKWIYLRINSNLINTKNKIQFQYKKLI